MPKPNYILSNYFNQKQVELYNAVVLACNRKSDVRIFALGGAIRGGKTFGVMIVLDQLCRQYPNSKWIIVRADYPRLLRTTIPSYKKITKGVSCKWVMSQSDIRVEYPNGSSVHFMPESASSDPQLTRMLGLECNGVLIEQAEEITYSCYNMLMSRVGTWIIDKMPPPLIFLTFNPAEGWFKELFHDKYMVEALPPDVMYITALPTDNKAITEEQLEHWKKMPKELYEQFVQGDWTAVMRRGAWLKNFDKTIHVTPASKAMFASDLPVYISIDWNFEKFCAIAFQTNSAFSANIETTWLKVFKEFVLENANIDVMANAIKQAFPMHVATGNIFVTGDKTGNRRDVGIGELGATYIRLLQKKLNIRDANMLFGQIDGISGNANLGLKESWVICNYFLQAGIFSVSERCNMSISDISKAKHDPKKGNSNLYKTPPSGDYDMGLMDCIRYAIHHVASDKITIHVS